MIKLSEAIALGAMKKPKAIGKLFNGIGTCAIGAALDAINEPFDICFLPKRWDPILRLGVAHPITGCEVKVRSIIVELNDEYDWTRERIAAWVATIEEHATEIIVEKEQEPALV